MAGGRGPEGPRSSVEAKSEKPVSIPELINAISENVKFAEGLKSLTRKDKEQIDGLVKELRAKELKSGATQSEIREFNQDALALNKSAEEIIEAAVSRTSMLDDQITRGLIDDRSPLWQSIRNEPSSKVAVDLLKANEQRFRGIEELKKAGIVTSGIVLAELRNDPNPKQAIKKIDTLLEGAKRRKENEKLMEKAYIEPGTEAYQYYIKMSPSRLKGILKKKDDLGNLNNEAYKEGLITEKEAMQYSALYREADIDEARKNLKNLRDRKDRSSEKWLGDQLNKLK